MSQALKPNVVVRRSPTTPSTQWTDGLLFVIAMWLLSRLLIVLAIQLIAPIYPTSPAPHPEPLPLDFTPGFVPKSDLALFAHWDGAWYRQIATSGYDYAADGKWHSIAFFPLFPLAIRAVMLFGFPFEVAGLLVSNLSLLGAMILLYRWVQEKHGASAARWATAVLAWCPFTLFSTVIYTESLFLLVSTAALRAFEKGEYVRAAVWGVLTSATRITGVMLVPTFLLVAWKERRPPIAYVVALATGLGLLAFSLFCAIRFGEPLAFVKVQKAWSHTAGGIDWQGWFNLLTGLFNIGFKAAEDWAKVLMLFGGGSLLWYLRRQISLVAVIYGLCSLALIIASGVLLSLGRHAYGIISIPLALGVFLSRYPIVGYILIGLSATLLTGLSIRFAWWHWVAYAPSLT